MLSDHDIARWRLRSQQLVQPLADGAIDAIGGLLAVQAENPRQSAGRWSLGPRISPEPSSGKRSTMVG